MGSYPTSQKNDGFINSITGGPLPSRTVAPEFQSAVITAKEEDWYFSACGQ
jgi:hypothetical protein